MDDSNALIVGLLQRGAHRLKGRQRRLFLAEAAIELCGGNARQAERRFGWGRATIDKGLHGLRQGIRCLENFAARGRPRWEDRNAPLARDIRELVEPHTRADPELKSSRRDTNGSAAEVLKALRTQKGHAADDLPSERTLRDLLNRRGDRLQRIQRASRSGRRTRRTPSSTT